MSEFKRNGTTEPVSLDRFLRRERGQGNLNFPVHLTTSRIGNLTRLIDVLVKGLILGILDAVCLLILPVCVRAETVS